MTMTEIASILGNLANLVAAIAVVASLFYVALQVRQNREAVEENTTAIRHTNAFEMTRFAANTRLQSIRPEIVATLAKDRAGKPLSDNEQITLELFIQYTFQEFEMAHYQAEMGRLDADVANAWNHRLTCWLLSAEMLETWQAQAVLFSDRFRKHVDTIVGEIEAWRDGQGSTGIIKFDNLSELVSDLRSTSAS